MDNKLIQIYNIEPETKLYKLLDENTELTEAVNNYINEQTDANMIHTINELIDTACVLFQLSIVKHGMNMDEIKAMWNEIVNRNVMIAKEMKSEGRTYKEVREMYRWMVKMKLLQWYKQQTESEERND